MQFDGLHAVADYAALYAVLRQGALASHLEGQLGDYQTHADVAGQTLSFTAADGSEIRSATTLVAVLDPDEITWGWAHPFGDPSGLAAAMRDTGNRYGIADLVSPRVGLPAHLAPAEVDAYLSETAEIVAAAAVHSTGHSPYHSADIGGGARAVLLLDDIALPEPTFADFATTMPGVLNTLAVNDHRVAIHGVAARLGWHIAWASGEDSTRSPTCDITDGISTAHIDFDRKGRPRSYRCSLGAAAG